MVTTAEIHSPPKEVLLNTFDEEPQPTIVSQEDDSSSTTDQMPAGSFQQETRELATACWDPQGKEDHPLQPKMGSLVTHQTGEKPPGKKGVHWKRDLSTFHYIEAEGEQKPTTATVLQDQEYASTRRSWCTNRSKRYRDQLVDWVTTMHQRHALNTNTEPHCQSPRLILNKPRITILQNTNRQESISPPQQIPQGNRKPLSQRQAEYAQHRARIFDYKLRPGVFHAHFFPP